MNKFDSVKVGTAASEVCGKCGMHTEDSEGCCRDEVKVVKLQIDKQLAKVFTPSFALALAEVPVSQHLYLPFYNFEQAYVELSTGPPIPHNPPIYLSNRVFRI